MTEPIDIKATLDKWQAALKKRDELLALLGGLEALMQDGSIQPSSVAEVRQLLVAAQEQVDLLQGLLLSPNGVSGS